MGVYVYWVASLVGAAILVARRVVGGLETAWRKWRLEELLKKGPGGWPGSAVSLSSLKIRPSFTIEAITIMV